MMNHVLSMDGFYFSTTYDLTHTLQRLSNTSPEFQEMSLLERVSLIFYFFFLILIYFLIFRSIPLFYPENIYWFFSVLAVSGSRMGLWKHTMFQVDITLQIQDPRICMFHRHDRELHLCIFRNLAWTHMLVIS